MDLDASRVVRSVGVATGAGGRCWAAPRRARWCRAVVCQRVRLRAGTWDLWVLGGGLPAKEAHSDYTASGNFPVRSTSVIAHDAVLSPPLRPRHRPGPAQTSPKVQQGLSRLKVHSGSQYSDVICSLSPGTLSGMSVRAQGLLTTCAPILRSYSAHIRLDSARRGLLVVAPGRR